MEAGSDDKFAGEQGRGQKSTKALEGLLLVIRYLLVIRSRHLDPE
jgi:hypothetical protein